MDEEGEDLPDVGDLSAHVDEEEKDVSFFFFKNSF
jgi:hypothetical protein